MSSRRWINGRPDDADLGWVDDLAQVLGMVLRWLFVVLLNTWTH